MQGVDQEVLFIINQIVEELCVENSKFNETKSEKNFLIPTIPYSDLQNDTSNEILQKKQVKINTHNEEKVESRPPSTYTENYCTKSLAENNVKEFHSEDNVQRKTTINTFDLSISSPNENDNYIKSPKSPDDSWDETIEEAINKWQKKKFQDAFVQTIFHPPATTDSQCQCDFDLNDADSALSPSENPAKKKIKLETGENSSANYKAEWEFENPETPQNESKKSDHNIKYSVNYKAVTHFKSSRIRIGLSRRYKPRHLHTDLLI